MLIQRAGSHQLSALKFMLIREEENQRVLSLWKPYCVNSRTGWGPYMTRSHCFLLNKYSYKHTVTGDIQIVKPPEPRGGILMDEMGMGKSLALIALIVHTLHVASSPGPRSQGRFHERESNGARQAPTLIIAPKSSIAIFSTSSIVR